MGALGRLIGWIFGPDKDDVQPDPNVTPVNSEDQALLDLHNRQRGAIFALSINPLLSKAAQSHAHWMASNRSMTHKEGYNNVADRVNATGYKWSFVGENIASSPSADTQSVFDHWMQSPGHRANILNRNYKDVGFGVVQAEDGLIYWCVDFGRQWS